jgi:c-di-GMP-binding flagellar brake protein YcgR
MARDRSAADCSENLPIAPNEILQVRIQNDPNPVTYYSRVLSISKGILSMPWPTDRGIRLITRPGQILDFYFIRGGTPHYFCGLVEKANAGPLSQMEIAIKTPAQQVQRRQNCRVKCLLPIEIVYAKEDAGDKSSSGLTVKTVCTDLSAGGVSFRQARHTPEGTLVHVKLSLPDNGPPIGIPCSVIHSGYASEHQTLYRTALRYVALSEGDRSRIVRFIYRTQLKRTKR